MVIHLDRASELQPAERETILDSAEGVTPRERRMDGRRKLIGALERKASVTQAPLMAVLEAGRAAGEARKVRRLWILNAVGCEVTKGFLNNFILNPDAMAHVPDVGIRLDLPRRASAGRSPSAGIASTGWGDPEDRRGHPELHR